MAFEFPTEEQKALVRQQLGTSEEDIRQALANIRNWLQVQPHLPDVIDDERLERLYISCKCRTERVKQILDATYTLKNKFPEFMLNRDPLGEDIITALKCCKVPTMPRLTPQFHRVGVLGGISSDPSDLNPVHVAKACLMIINFILSFDYSVGYILLIDLKDMTAGHLSKLTIRDLRALELITRTAYAKRIKALHFLNAPKILNTVLSIVKLALPEKLQKRIMVHERGSQTLFEHLPKYVVPDEMGGTAGPVRDIMDSDYAELVKHREWFLEEDKYVADESKRPKDNGYSYELFGVDGSFKKLQLD
ncbi:alpha-tocopherol transfer protein-like [Schistocerca serialis cubense]|uniref:alpha-tocopherol transfer protein-like n=1 Tax=Schistocerca serialis cubense TaxID=2023355 RepID=UPI00214F35C5|nr:alpha-tocopherol transfer protein-like [Schistocerca serialis cubense]